MTFPERYRATRAEIAAEYHRLYDNTPFGGWHLAALLGALSIMGAVLALCIVARSP